MGWLEVSPDENLMCAEVAEGSSLGGLDDMTSGLSLAESTAPPAPAETVGRLVDEAIAVAAGLRRRPCSTYRLQLHAGFTIDQARAITPYLADLGVTDCYASPFLQAVPGSTHGYDITDHGRINVEVGDDASFAAWVAEMKRLGMGLLLDVVPNHIGVAGNHNARWNDVLENGQASLQSQYADIDWLAPTRPENQNRVLLAVLGDLYGSVLERGELKVVRADGAFSVHYAENHYPLDPRSYAFILDPALGRVQTALGVDHESVLELESILTALRNLPEHTDSTPSRMVERRREQQIVKRRLAHLAASEPVVACAIDESLVDLNGTPGEPRSFDALDRLLDVQAFRLAYWRVAADEINYRRFFDINTLVAIRMDRIEVFRHTHRLILDWVARGDATGLRIDHPDGLLDPRQYLERLQQGLVLRVAQRAYESGRAAASDAPPWSHLEPAAIEEIARRSTDVVDPASLYVVVEKILGPGETLPADWPTRGTSGYDTLVQINNLFVDPASAEAFTRGYERWIGHPLPFEELVHEKKLQVLRMALASELHVLAYQLSRIAQQDRRSRDFTLSNLRRALREVIAAFPVYRSYITTERISNDDQAWVDRAVRTAMRRNPEISRAVFLFLRNTLVRRETLPADAVVDPELALFAGKFQQVTSPVMAKGLEDTTFYIYNRLLSLNEVGGEPSHFGSTPDELHAWYAARQARHPEALTPLTTHDTKRSEGVRARLNVLSENPQEWFRAVARWSESNARHRIVVDEAEVPGRNEEYQLYQTLIGAWPIEGLSTDEDGPDWDAFRDRIRAYMSKAVHEAKVYSSWVNPNEDYDQALDTFVTRILDPKENRAFLDDFAAYQSEISEWGMVNALSQTLLRIAGPGVPDTYQGTELWDNSLVDPDNRRPVDYELRRTLLDRLKSRLADSDSNDLTPLTSDLWRDRHDASIKLYTVWRSLTARRDHPDLFGDGSYCPAETRGPKADHVFAFARRQGDEAALVVVPRFPSRLAPPGAPPIGPDVWGDTSLFLPEWTGPLKFRDRFTGAEVTLEAVDGGAGVRVAEVLRDFPVALLLAVD
jgi:(1->4)-alpha-D-glucan 1-alpha-D-glucosylmutase